MVQFRDLHRQCSATEVNPVKNAGELKESAKTFNASIEKPQRVCDALMTTPTVDPKCDPQKAVESHRKWKKALREKVREKVWGR